MDIFSALGFTSADGVLLATSSLCGLIGSVVRALMMRNSLESLPQRPDQPPRFSLAFVYNRFNWYWAWGIVGLGSGLLVGLLFVGTLQPGVGSVARVLAAALLAGYGAPAFWKRQEETFERILQERLNKSTPTTKTPRSRSDLT